jgi:hypothetical protein
MLYDHISEMVYTICKSYNKSDRTLQTGIYQIIQRGKKFIQIQFKKKFHMHIIQFLLQTFVEVNVSFY